MHCGNDNIILGMPWLQTVNPTIDWNSRTVSIPETADQSKTLLQQDALTYASWKDHLPRPTPSTVNVTSTDRLFEYLNYETPEDFAIRAHDAFTINRIIKCGSRFVQASVIRKLSTALDLATAAAKDKPEVALLPEYAAFSKVFDEPTAGTLPPSRPYDHEINMKETFVPKIGKIYPLSPKERTATNAFIDEHLASRKIHPSNSPQASPFFFIKKKDGKLRPCQDYRYLNEHTVHDAYPLPLISDLIDKLQGAELFTKFDVWWGYNNVRIKDGHQWKGAFTTHRGLFEPLVMFFGMTNSPTTFQQFMNDSFRDMIAEGWLLIYMDDLLIFSPNAKTHEEWTKRVLTRMEELDLHLRLSKCEFTSKRVEYLGMIIEPGHVTMDPVKLDGIASWPTPTKVRDIQSFLGFANYYRRFIPEYSTVARPLLDLTKKDHSWNWTPACQESFNKLKKLFLS